MVAANDGTAGGAIAALKAAGVNPVPPVTGNDATIAGLQLIIAGDQYNTISKPSEVVAAAAADVVVALLQGETPKSDETLFGTPTRLFTPALVTSGNLKTEITDKMIDGKPIPSPPRHALHRPLRRRLQEARHRQVAADRWPRPS